MEMAERSRVSLPPGVGSSFEVYVNGVRQREGADFVRDGYELVFHRRLAREGKLGFWRWSSIFFGVAGTYRQNDSIDVRYEAADGSPRVAEGLEIEPGWTAFSHGRASFSALRIARVAGDRLSV